MALAPGQGLAATVPPERLPFLPMDVLQVESALDGLQDAYGSQAVILAVCPKGLLTEVKRAPGVCFQDDPCDASETTTGRYSAEVLR